MASGGPLDAILLKALGHPLRALIFETINDRGETSPIELVRELGEPIGTVSHHVRVLRDLGCIEVVRTRQRRGAVEHFYRTAVVPFLDDAQWEQLPVTMRRALAAQTFRRVFREASAAGGAGGFDRAGAHIDRVLLDLDEQGWSALSDLLTETLRRAQALQDESDTRRRDLHDGGDGVEEGERRSPSELAILHFARGDVTPTAPEPKPPERRGRPSRRP